MVSPLPREPKKQNLSQPPLKYFHPLSLFSLQILTPGCESEHASRYMRAVSGGRERTLRYLPTRVRPPLGYLQPSALGTCHPGRCSLPPPFLFPLSWPGRGCDPAKPARIGLRHRRNRNRSSPSVRPPPHGPQHQELPPSPRPSPSEDKSLLPPPPKSCL